MLVPKDNELIRTNRLLLGVSIAAVVLLGPLFVLGYVSGYRTAKENESQGASETALVSSQLSMPSPAATKQSERTSWTLPTGRVSTQQSAPAARVDRPAAGQVYLQLVTAAKSRSVTIIDALRNDGFPVVASEVPGKPGLDRVLIGPLNEGEVDKTRANLQSKGFPGDSAIERTF